MVPTIAASGDYLVYEKLTPYYKLVPGDVVLFTSPLNPNYVLCKRIIGMVSQLSYLYISALITLFLSSQFFVRLFCLFACFCVDSSKPMHSFPPALAPLFAAATTK